MTQNDQVVETIRQCGLGIEPREAQRILTPVLTAMSTLDLGQKNAVLLILERVVLLTQGGHRLTSFTDCTLGPEYSYLDLSLGLAI